MNTTTNTTTKNTTATAPTLSELRARKYAHAVDRFDNARTTHGESVLAFCLAFVAFACGAFVVIASHVANVSAFMFGHVGQIIARGASVSITTVSFVVLVGAFRTMRATMNAREIARRARFDARAELLNLY